MASLGPVAETRGVDADAGELRVRHAGPLDVAALAELQFRVPSREALATAGSAKAAERFRAGLLDHALAAGTSTIVLLEDSRGVAGFAEVTTGGDMPPAGAALRAAVRAMGVPRAVRAGLGPGARESDVHAGTER